MGVYAGSPLHRDPSYTKESFGTERLIPIGIYPHRYPEIINQSDDMMSVGSNMILYDVHQGWPQTSLSFYRTWEMVGDKATHTPHFYEVTYVKCEQQLIPFHLKSIGTYSVPIIQLRNLEKIYANTPNGPILFDNPVLSLLGDLSSYPDRYGLDSRFINPLETLGPSVGILRNYSYDFKSPCEAQHTLSSFAEHLLYANESSRHAQSWGNCLAPLDLDPRLTYALSGQGTAHPNARWSPHTPPIETHSSYIPERLDIPWIIQPNTLEGFLTEVSSIPLTEFDISLCTDTTGCWGQIDPVSIIDRYGSWRNHFHLFERISTWTRHSFAMISLAFNTLRETARELPKEGSAIRIRITKTFHDELVLVFSTDNGRDFLGVYFDLVKRSLTSYGVTSVYAPQLAL